MCKAREKETQTQGELRGLKTEAFGSVLSKCLLCEIWIYQWKNS